MTLRARLTLFFIGIVVVPLVVAAFALRSFLAGDVERRTNTRLEASARAVSAVWLERLDGIREDVAEAARRLGTDLTRGRGPHMDRVRRGGELDFLVLIGDRDVRASIGTASFLPQTPVPGATALAEGTRVPALRAEVQLNAGGARRRVVGGIFADADLAADLQAAAGLDVAVLLGDRYVASTLPTPPRASAVQAGGPFELPDGRGALLVPVTGTAGQGVVLVAPLEPAVAAGTLWALVGMAVLIAILFGWLLARVLARPLERLAEGARAVTSGDLGVRLDPAGEADIGKVADAFNTMTTSLQTYVDELKDSRDELRRGLARLGATLQSTHDLDAMLGVVLDSAATTLGARSGMVFLQAGTGFRLEVSKGFQPPSDARLVLGKGVAGRAAMGRPVLFPGDPGVAPDVEIEPVSNTAMAVPLMRGQRTIGVLALYHRAAPEAFDDEDASTLATFSTQASVAIENVLLHREAERLSITDGLTGVWNRRYLQLTLSKELDRAQRFGRPLSVLMVDIDHFKVVNDRHGHQRGDEILVELTRRILGQIRTQIDFLTRYGGEEFVIVLPETPGEGALVVAEKIRAAIADAPFQTDTQIPVSITVSIGAAVYPADGSTVPELVGAADAAMYRAKDLGRDRIQAAGAV